MYFNTFHLNFLLKYLFSMYNIFELHKRKRCSFFPKKERQFVKINHLEPKKIADKFKYLHEVIRMK
mgnify:CR=1 FL=1